jgi:tetratricopeptide (TPR) repeat protein
MRKSTVLIFLFVLIGSHLPADAPGSQPVTAPALPVAPPLALSLAWKAGMVFGQFEGAQYSNWSPMVAIAADLPLPLGFREVPDLIFSARGEVDWGFFSHKLTYDSTAHAYLVNPGDVTSMYSFMATAGFAARYNLLEWLGVSADAQAGFYDASSLLYQMSGTTPGTQLGLGLRAGAGVDLAFETAGWNMSVGIRAEYAWMRDLWQGVISSVVLGMHAPAAAGSAAGSGATGSPELLADSEASEKPSLFSMRFTPGFGFTLVSLYAGQPATNLMFTREDFRLTAVYGLPFFPALRLRADAAVKTNFGADTFAYGDLGLGIGVGFLGGWDASLYATEGIVSSFASGAPSTAFADLLVTAAGLDLSYSFSPAYSMGIEMQFSWINGRYGEVSTGMIAAYHFPTARKPAAQKKTPALPEAKPAEEKPRLLEKPAEPTAPKTAQPEPKQAQVAEAPREEQPAPPKAAVAEQPKAPAQPAPVALAAQPRPEAVTQKPVEERGRGLVIREVAIGNIFPIFHTYYDDHPIGKLVIRNTEFSPITDLTVSLIIRQYMDAPKECAVIREMKAGEEQSVDLYALFKNTILDITQATKVAAEVSVAYTLNGRQATAGKVETIRIYDRNAMTWDDDRKAAAFVTPKEPAVLIFSNNVNAALKGKLNKALDRNLQTAIALHDALRLYGVSYVSNPLTPYAVASQDKAVVDTLKFPRQTFEYRSGDCSDLSILYSALMESVQIETAFITIPGHIFMAFALRSTPEEIRASFSQTDELIFRNDKVWVPIEVTEREKTFLDAWQTGAKEWRENLSRNQAGFFPIHDAWGIYEPVGLPGSGNPPALPDPAQVVKDFRDDVSRLVDREIYGKVAALQAAITKSQESPKSINALGILYARYDLTDRAEREFKRATAKVEFTPALVNLGNLAFLRGDSDGALAWYVRANKKDSRNPVALLGIARASHEIENYATVRKAFAELKAIDPDLASRFAYLELKGEEATRAADLAQVRDQVVWQE